MSYNRYKSNKITKLVDGKRKYNSVIYPTIDKNEKDIYIYAVKGDRLDTLAYQYYGDAALWPVIASVNNVGKGTLYINAGLQIRIPHSPDEFIEKTKKNKENR